MNAPANKLELEEDDDFTYSIEEDAGDEDEIEIEDDTPEADRDRSPMPKEIVDELEADELEEYSDKVKTRLKQMKKVWHDERRAKEDLGRQQEESIALAKRLIAENKSLKSRYADGEQTLVSTYKAAAELELANAKRAYKEAYDSGDSDAVVEAQQALNTVNSKLDRVNNYRPTLQAEENSVYTEQSSVKTPDSATLAWQERNKWYGTDSEMTALALGYHQTLEREKGKQYIGTTDYWKDVDKRMKKRFPEYFGDTQEIEDTDSGGGRPTGRTDKKPASVVASASRSTGSKRIVLTRSQVKLAKKLGLTNEQYARECVKLENDNG